MPIPDNLLHHREECEEEDCAECERIWEITEAEAPTLDDLEAMKFE